MIHTNNRGIAGRIVIQQTKPEPTFSTQMQSSSFKRKILDAATRDGSLHELYWMIEFRAPVRTLPPSIRPPGTIMGSVVFAASFPGKHIPLIPVAPDPLASMEYAELLKGVLYAKNRHWVQEIGVALTNREVMQGYKWYEWGDRLPAGDEFCRTCGGVGECWYEQRLALVAGRGVVHLSTGGQRALCGRCIQGARWVSPLTSWERRRLGDGVCRNCERVQMSPTEARDLALNLLMCADAAENDAFLVTFLRRKVKADDRAIAGILQEYRKWRDDQAHK